MEYEEWEQKVIEVLGEGEFSTDEQSFWKSIYELGVSPEVGVELSMTFVD